MAVNQEEGDFRGNRNVLTTANDTGRSTWKQERVSAVNDDDSKFVFVNIHDRLVETSFWLRRQRAHAVGRS